MAPETRDNIRNLAQTYMSNPNAIILCIQVGAMIIPKIETKDFQYRKLRKYCALSSPICFCASVRVNTVRFNIPVAKVNLFYAFEMNILILKHSRTSVLLL